MSSQVTLAASSFTSLCLFIFENKQEKSLYNLKIYLTLELLKVYIVNFLQQLNYNDTFIYFY